MLRVKVVHPPADGAPGRVICDFVDCLFPETLRKVCERDLRDAMKGLWKRTEELVKKQQEEEQEPDYEEDDFERVDSGETGQEEEEETYEEDAFERPETAEETTETEEEKEE